jgi:hypothetical protein
MPILSFRRKVEEISDSWARYCLMLAYLTAGRSNELAGVQLPSDIRPTGAGGNTSSYDDGDLFPKDPQGDSARYFSQAIGPKVSDVEYEKMEDGSEAMKITLRTEKRANHPLRIIALPMGPVEPWTQHLRNCFQRFGAADPLVPFNRRQLSRYYLRYGFTEKADTEARKNPLRHVRLNHLLDYYRLSPVEVSLYSGWSLSAASRSVGGAGTLADYAHLRWREYYPRLLKPLPSP